MSRMTEKRRAGRPRAKTGAPPPGKILVRIPPELHGRLIARAETDRRSVNATVLVALEDWLATRDVPR